jgi:hypothetical protein
LICISSLLRVAKRERLTITLFIKVLFE